ncbi:MAG: flagellar basal body rod protein FlgC [Desulfobacterales bacterium]
MMDFFDALKTSASGLTAQRIRMNLISGNLANANTTRTADGGPYRRKDLVVAAAAEGRSFADVLRAQQEGGPVSVKPLAVVEDQRPPIRKYEPGHPDADDDGYVLLPNVNVTEEMVNLVSASRSYEANIAAVKAAKSMAQRALEIGK